MSTPIPERWHGTKMQMDVGIFGGATSTMDLMLDDIATLESQLGREQRTMKFWEESYLAEHEHWGECKWKKQVAALEAQNRTLQYEALVDARDYLKSYFAKHNMGVRQIISSQWVQGVCSGRQEAVNLLEEAVVKARAALAATEEKK